MSKGKLFINSNFYVRMFSKTGQSPYVQSAIFRHLSVTISQLLARLNLVLTEVTYARLYKDKHIL